MFEKPILGNARNSENLKISTSVRIAPFMPSIVISISDSEVKFTKLEVMG